MVVCRTCGVELDEGIAICPLCETVVNGEVRKGIGVGQAKEKTKRKSVEKYALQRMLWQITAVLLLSGILGTLIIDLSVQGSVTWSVYPVTISLMVFSYASLMAFWHTKIILQVVAAWVISIVVLFVVYYYIPTAWPVQLALPILCAANVIGLTLYYITMNLKMRGLNVVAIFFVAIAVLCMVIEGILSFYLIHTVALKWSVIVAACLLPVTAALLFMYFRTRHNPDIKKIFHT
ncbi:MAG: hypothetical protein WA874_04035 [Chryseosolibacter sp.]